MAVSKGFKIYLHILTFTPAVFNKFSHLTVAVENLFFSGIARKYWRLKLRASFRYLYKGADKSLTRTTSRCILFDVENISFDASLVIYK